MTQDTSADRQRTLRNVTIFSIAALTCGWIGLWIDSLLGQSGDQTLGMLIWLGTPLTVSLLLRAFAGDGWRDLGLRLNLRSNVSMYLISLLLYPATGLIVIGAGALTGNVTLTSRSIAELLPLFGSFLLLGIPKNIIEEFAWRGYLAPKLFLLNIDTLGRPRADGLIWGAWHLPYLAFVLAYVPEGPPTVVTRFLIGYGGCIACLRRDPPAHRLRLACRAHAYRWRRVYRDPAARSRHDSGNGIPLLAWRRGYA